MAGAFVLGALEPADDGGRARAPRDLRRRARRDRRAGWRAAGPGRERAGRRAAGGSARRGSWRPRPRTSSARDGRPGPRRPRATAPAGATTPAAARADAFPTASERSASARAARRPTGTWILRIAAVVAIVALGRLEPAAPEPAQRARRPISDERRGGPRRGRPAGFADRDPDRRPTGPAPGLAAVSADGRGHARDAGDLAPTSGSTVYTAWAIGGDGVPVALGSFTVGSDGTATFEAASPALAAGTVIALTREPTPGTTTPTVPIVSKGVATAPA